MTEYEKHYCGERHNPKYPCPAPEWRPGGVPLSKLPGCECKGLEHEPKCPRRQVIQELERRRRG